MHNFKLAKRQTEKIESPFKVLACSSIPDLKKSSLVKNTQHKSHLVGAFEVL